MDEKTLLALTALAQKLGTTAEYLWGVLIKQAAVTGVTNIIEMSVWLAIAIAWGVLTYRKTRKVLPEGAGPYSCASAEWEEEAAFFAWLGAFLLAVTAAIVACVGVSDSVAAFLNPEYWALKQILH